MGYRHYLGSFRKDRYEELNASIERLEELGFEVSFSDYNPCECVLEDEARLITIDSYFGLIHPTSTSNDINFYLTFNDLTAIADFVKEMKEE